MLASTSVCRVCRAKGFDGLSQKTNQVRQFSSRISQSTISQQGQMRFTQSTTSRSLIAASRLRNTHSLQPRLFGSQIRHNSSLNSGVQNAADSVTSAAQSTADFISDSGHQLAQAAATTDASRTPGYLRDMGLDFGWGFSTTMQHLLETIHSMNITEWGGSILLTTVIVRLCVFPFIKSSSDTSAKLQWIRPESQALMTKMKEAAAKSDQMAVQSVRSKIKALYRSKDIKLWRMGLPFVQIPFGFGMWRVCRNMADAGIPGLEHGGYLWFQNLTMSDPYFILPMSCAVFQHLSMRYGGETGVQDEKSAKLRKTLMYVLPTLTPVFIGFAPGAIQLTFASAAFLSLVSTSILRNPVTRSMLKMTPFPTAGQVAVAPAAPYRGTITLASNVNNSASTRSKPPVVASPVKRIVDAVKPSKITEGVNGFFKNVTDMMGDTMPQAQQKVQTRREKAQMKEAQDYEARRRKEVDEKDFNINRTSDPEESRQWKNSRFTGKELDLETGNCCEFTPRDPSWRPSRTSVCIHLRGPQVLL